MADTCEGVVSYGVCIPKQSCQYVMKIPRQYRCQFAKQTEDCKDKDTLLDYTTFVLCKFNEFDSHIYFAYIYLVLYLILGFAILSTITHYFFPSLCYLVSVLGIPRNVASATLIAWGYAAPNLLMLMIAAMRGSWECVLCQVVGAGIYEFTCLVALISIIKPFFMQQFLFLRLTIFYVGLIIVLALTNLDEHILIYEAIGYMLVYSIKLIIDILDDLVSSIYKNPAVITQTDLLVKEETREDDMEYVRSRSESSNVQIASDRMKQALYDKYITNTHHKRPTRLAMYVRQNLDSQFVDLPPPQVPRSYYILWESSRNALLSTVRLQRLKQCGYHDLVDAERNANKSVIAVDISGYRIIEKNTNLSMDFIHMIIPLHQAQWDRYNFVGKIASVITAPTVYFCKIFIPCVDDGVLTNNWCKLLACLQCVTAPIILWLTLNRWIDSFNVTMLAISLSCAFVAFFVLLRFSHVRTAPSYHIAFIFAGFLVCTAVLFYVAYEIVRLLDVCAYVFSIRPPTLWMTVLAWGNSIGDILNCINLSKAGYPRIALACIFRSNLLLVSIGVGCAFLYIILVRGEKMSLSGEEAIEVIYVGFFYLIATQAFTLIIIPSLHFRFRRSYAVFLLVAYFMFLLHCYLCELKLLESIV